MMCSRLFGQRIYAHPPMYVQEYSLPSHSIATKVLLPFSIVNLWQFSDLANIKSWKPKSPHLQIVGGLIFQLTVMSSLQKPCREAWSQWFTLHSPTMQRRVQATILKRRQAKDELLTSLAPFVLQPSPPLLSPLPSSTLHHMFLTPIYHQQSPNRFT